MKDILIGIDCGGTNIKAACADRRGRIILQKKLHTFPEGAAEGIEDRIIRLTEELMGSLDRDSYRVKAVGMGIPGVYYRGEVMMSPNIGSLDARKIVNHFKNVHNLSFSIMNDVKCAALGEKWLGAGRSSDNMIYVNIGTGLSMAFILNGRLYQGENNASGEIGYWIYDPDMKEGCSSGRAPLEEIFSGKGIADSVNAACGTAFDTREVFEAYRQGVPGVRKIIDENIKHFITALANVSILLNPEIIVFGGSVSDSMGIFEERISAYFRETVIFPPAIRKTALLGDAGIYGAVRLAMLSRKDK